MAKVASDGTLDFSAKLDLKDQLLYILLLVEQCEWFLKELHVPEQMFEKEEDLKWLRNFKKQIKLNKMGTEVILDGLPADELVVRIKVL